MKTLTTTQMEHLMEDEEALVINVLDEEDFERAHIPGTANIPVSSDDFVERVEEKAERMDRPIVVYCAGPECDASPTAAETLEEAGFSEVFDYEGGMKAWIAAGNEAERAAGVH